MLEMNQRELHESIDHVREKSSVTRASVWWSGCASVCISYTGQLSITERIQSMCTIQGEAAKGFLDQYVAPHFVFSPRSPLPQSGIRRLPQTINRNRIVHEICYRLIER